MPEKHDKNAASATSNGRWGMNALIRKGFINTAGYFEANGAFTGEDVSYYSVGGYGEATGSRAYSIGLYGLGYRSNPNLCYSSLIIGIYGEGRNDLTNCPGAIDPLAGFFAGKIVVEENPIILSDGQFKTQIEEIDNSLELLGQLSPKSYHFNNEEYEDFQFSNERQYGFIAQEMEEVFPELVHDGLYPARLDSSGNVVREELEYKGVQYASLVPILVAGMQEQQAQIEDLQNRLNEMSEDRFKSNDGGDEGQMAPTPQADYELFQNRPNPFAESTEIVWRMADDAQARIVVQNAQGNQVAMLYDGESAKGLHSLEWNANGLPSGTYFYSLIVNGELHVKRAIKIQ